MSLDTTIFLSNLRLLSSEIIKVTAATGKPFHVHRPIFNCSKPLRRITRHAPHLDLSPWDSDTVARFLQFLYVGAYQSPELILGGESSSSGSLSPASSSTLTSASMESRELVNALNFLLTHAKLYTLAASHDIEALRLSAYGNLYDALEGLGDIEERSTVARVVEMLEYIYKNTVSDEPIREMVVAFCANNLEVLVKSIDMRMLLCEEGEFVVDVVEGMAERMGGMAELMEELEKELERVENELKALVRELKGLRPELETETVGLSWETRGVPRRRRREVPESSVKETRSPERTVKKKKIAVNTVENIYKLFMTLMHHLTLKEYLKALFMCTLLFLSLTAISYHHSTIGSKAFQEICARQSVNSWTEADLLTIGNIPLKEACLTHTPGERVPKPRRVVYGDEPGYELKLNAEMVGPAECERQMDGKYRSVDVYYGYEDLREWTMPTVESRVGEGTDELMAGAAEGGGFGRWVKPVVVVGLGLVGWWGYVRMFVRVGRDLVVVGREFGAGRGVGVGARAGGMKRRRFIYPSRSTDAI